MQNNLQEKIQSRIKDLENHPKALDIITSEIRRLKLKRLNSSGIYKRANFVNVNFDKAKDWQYIQEAKKIEKTEV